MPPWQDRRSRPRIGYPVQARTTRSANAFTRLGLFAVVAIVLALGGALLGYRILARSSAFTVHDVAIRGASPPMQREIVRAVQAAVAGRSLLSLDAGSVARAIEGVPTIAHASVDRDFPSTLRVHVIPERAAIQLCRQTCKQAVSVSTEGRVLGPAASQRLPRVWTTRAVPGAGERVGDPGVLVALTVLAGRRPTFPARILTILTHARGVRLKVDGGLEIRLGPPVDLAEKMRAAETMLRAELATPKARSQAVYLTVEDPTTPAILDRSPGYTVTKAYGDLAKQTEQRLADEASGGSKPATVTATPTSTTAATQP